VKSVRLSFRVFSSFVWIFFAFPTFKLVLLVQDDPVMAPDLIIDSFYGHFKRFLEAGSVSDKGNFRWTSTGEYDRLILTQLNQLLGGECKRNSNQRIKTNRSHTCKSFICQHNANVTVSWLSTGNEEEIHFLISKCDLCTNTVNSKVLDIV
jgi:hypothetical protein